MLKSQRDSKISSLKGEDRESVQRVIAAIKDTRGNSPDLARSDGGTSARELLQDWQDVLTLEAMSALEAILARDESGPRAGEFPEDFHLKRLGSEERVRLSEFRDKRPVALAFGSYT
ncbi:MAG: hypothetical protein OXI91_03870 [Chloroflexota bacterium]|nr:hypothetical protein [Chloroflexota bacterium]